MPLTKINSDALSRGTYCSWKDSANSECLLVTTPPGRGKSVLSNFIVENLQKQSFKVYGKSCKVIYNFCNIRNEEQFRNANSALRALIVQLCEQRQNLFRLIPKDLYNNGPTFLPEGFENLWSIFENMANASSYERLYCVIDGLDVYQHGMHDIITRLNITFNISNAKVSVRKLFCTSRPDKDVLDAWRQPRKRLHYNSKVIGAFISSRVDSLNNRFNQEMKDLIKDNLSSRAENTFLWLDVVIRKIKSISYPSCENIENTIEQSSEDLYELYQDLITKAVDASEENARILVWAVYAQEPLAVPSLGDAISIDPRHTRVKDFSKSRLTLQPDVLLKELGTLLDVVGDHVYLIHQSLKDYFENRNPLSNYFDRIEPRLVPAYVCMTYLSLEEVNYTVHVSSSGFVMLRITLGHANTFISIATIALQ